MTGPTMPDPVGPPPPPPKPQRPAATHPTQPTTPPDTGPNRPAAPIPRSLESSRLLAASVSALVVGVLMLLSAVSVAVAWAALKAGA